MEKYGLMILDNVGGMDSKVSTISLYMYNYIIIDDSFRELKTLFLDMAKDEMKNDVQRMYGTMSRLRGCDIKG